MAFSIAPALLHKNRDTTEPLPILPWLQKMLYRRRVFFSRGFLSIIPMLLFQPGKPIASMKPRILWLTTIFVCVRPLRSTFHDLTSQWNTRLAQTHQPPGGIPVWGILIESNRDEWAQ